MKQRPGCSVEVVSLAVGGAGGGLSSGGGAGGARSAGGAGPAREAAEEEGDGEARPGGGGGGGASSSSSSSSALRAASAALEQGSGSAGGESLEAASARGTGMLVRRVTQPGRRLACSACAAAFDSSEEHREHHRGDWHRFNLKRKMKALEPLPADAFAALPAKDVKAFIEDYD